MLIYGILGFRFKEVFELNPIKQKQISHIKLSMNYQQKHIKLELNQDLLSINVSKPMKIRINNQLIEIINSYTHKINENS